MGHVRKVPSKTGRQAVVDDDTKLNLLLALEENPITPARQLARDNWFYVVKHLSPASSQFGKYEWLVGVVRKNHIDKIQNLPWKLVGSSFLNYQACLERDLSLNVFTAAISNRRPRVGYFWDYTPRQMLVVMNVPEGLKNTYKQKIFEIGAAYQLFQILQNIPAYLLDYKYGPLQITCTDLSPALGLLALTLRNNLLCVIAGKLTHLDNPKDKIDNNEKSGIYEIICKDCDENSVRERNYPQRDSFGTGLSDAPKECGARGVTRRGHRGKFCPIPSLKRLEMEHKPSLGLALQKDQRRKVIIGSFRMRYAEYKLINDLLRGYLKCKAYINRLDNIEDLKQKISNKIQAMPEDFLIEV
ncbi:hypothetical protein NQ318_004007 [Aromia moschata]|uniref:Uncharacterized protein n=1 Tax=Aromia moschata TaxID=1265417 RepID=A0AAV8Z9Q5_9CUCU|nr:hypothetical protein NQ318_004007 [Aromia moschata]